MILNKDQVKRLISHLDKGSYAVLTRDNQADAIETIEAQQLEIERLKDWVNDLQSGMYVNCVYCGHRYGAEDEVPSSMAHVLKEHIEQCHEHPMSKLKQQLHEKEAKNRELITVLEKCREHVPMDMGYCLYDEINDLLEDTKVAE
ncbi:hypothetical protein [Anaerosolibacter sp.]|uniref:hypothetical protein n=1 Tax=Anaerosolibacter sp. TaxID=1872527 RepID=UPI0039F0E1CF